MGERHRSNRLLRCTGGVQVQPLTGTPPTCVGFRGLGGRDALEGKAPQRGAPTPPHRRLEEVDKVVGGGYCRLQIPFTLALGIRGTVAGYGLGALDGWGGGASPHSNASLGGGGACQGLQLGTPHVTPHYREPPERHGSRCIKGRLPRVIPNRLKAGQHPLPQREGGGGGTKKRVLSVATRPPTFSGQLPERGAYQKNSSPLAGGSKVGEGGGGGEPSGFQIPSTI